MGGLDTVAATGWTPAPPSSVFSLVAAGATWPEWSSLGSFELEAAGADGGEGVGAIRVFRTLGLFRSREQIVDVEPDRALAYVLLPGSRGLAMRDYRAEVRLSPERDGTRIDWVGTFRPALPATGWFWRAFMGQTYRSLIKGLIEATSR
jgi:uncharacterized protein YndB with AHSA1/START domain